MPAHACCVDSTVVPPVAAFADSLPSSVPFLGLAKESLEWSPSRSSALYKIDKWGAPYFSVNSDGNISIHPYGTDTKALDEIDLLQIVKRVSGPKSSGGLGLQLPLIVRLPDMLNHRLNALQSAFEAAIKTQGYKLHYQGVYPVKSNQDRYVVEDIVRFGKSFHFGLEAGSKAELLLCMSCLCKGSSEALLICDGFKDAEYISLALIARKLALNTVIVLEQEEELDSVIELSKMLSVNKFVIGLRVKLQTMHSGHFGATSGEDSKFGLNVTQILRVVKKLEQAGMLDCLQLLHFHIGSQIPSTYLLADALNEAAQIYCELVHLGAHMKVIDIGGGLGIDYDGSESAQSKFSVEYGLDDYALVVVQTIKNTCDRESVNHPVICSESGRAIVSHHSVLIFEAVSPKVEQTPDRPSLGLQHLVEALTDEGRAEYKNLDAAAKRADYKACSTYVDQLKRHCVNQFKDGSLPIKHLAAIDGLCEFYMKQDINYDPVRIYKINLSIFTSIPDFWGIDHLFPIIPIHRLKLRPIRKGILSDLTCDSDGKIHTFIGNNSSLPLHETKDLCGVCGDGEKYYLGMFLGGAYQEALGGLHNLFGRPSVVRVSITDAPHGFEVEHNVVGMSCADVLKVMQYEPELMLQTLKDRGKECEYGDYLADVADIVSRLSRSFRNMPYLIAGSSSCITNVIENAANE